MDHIQFPVSQPDQNSSAIPSKYEIPREYDPEHIEGPRGSEPSEGALGSRNGPPLQTVIASAPGIMAQSLRAMMESVPLVRVVGIAAGCLSALQMVREFRPALIVIDTNLPIEDVQVLLQQLKREELPTRSLVLAATWSQAQQTQAAGADIVFRRDGSSRQLGALVAALCA
jgi:CheY-like chemotaxis protein